MTGCDKPKGQELGGLRGQADLDVAQTLAIGELREGHDTKLLSYREVANVVIPVATGSDPLKSLPRQAVHDLGEEGLAAVHYALSVQRPKRA